MGVWDFAVYLSGRDLPTRNIDDLAIMLAPYRGKNMIIEYDNKRQIWLSASNKICKIMYLNSYKWDNISEIDCKVTASNKQKNFFKQE